MVITNKVIITFEYFDLVLFFFIIGAVMFEFFLIQNVKSLRKVNNWRWQDKSKLQTRLITIPSVVFLIFVILVFGSLFITGTMMSSYGYNKIQKIYLITDYALSGIMFLIMGWAFSPWVFSYVFDSVTIRYKKN